MSFLNQAQVMQDHLGRPTVNFLSGPTVISIVCESQAAAETLAAHINNSAIEVSVGTIAF